MDQLTYEQLFDTLRREKSRDELQALAQGFYSDARVFLAGKKNATEGTEPNSAAAQKASIEYQNARRILRELYDRRERKIVTLAMHKTRTEGAVVDNDTLLPEERVFFDTLVQLLQGNRKNVLEAVAHVQLPVETPKEPETLPEEPSPSEAEIKVKFLSTVPKFVGKDLEIFGPYEEGSVATLPESVANILIGKGRAEPVEATVSTS